MRLYFFVNQYSIGIQAGIQAGHAAQQLDHKYPHDSTSHQEVKTFVKDYGSWYVLNGGDHLALKSIKSLLERIEFNQTALGEDGVTPWAYFKEPGLNNAFTAIAVLLPERMYDSVAKAVGKGHTPDYEVHYTKVEVEFLKILFSCPFAK